MTKMNNISLKLEKSPFNSVKITKSEDAVNVIRQFYQDDISLYESFFMLLLGRNNKTTGFVKISQGGTAGTVVDTKIVAKYAIDSLCSGVIIAHNHPSGNTEASQADRKITQKIKDGLKLFDIDLLDHVILTDLEHYSFADNGEI